MGGGRGGGMGMGGGRGGGMGMGGGRGGGMGMGQSPATGSGTAGTPLPGPGPEAGNPARENELAMLKQQAEVMGRQMRELHDRINELGAKDRTLTAKVDVEKCAGCGICVDTCPVDAITLEDDLAVVDENVCDACGKCVEECPNDAIRLS